MVKKVVQTHYVIDGEDVKALRKICGIALRKAPFAEEEDYRMRKLCNYVLGLDEEQDRPS